MESAPASLFAFDAISPAFTGSKPAEISAETIPVSVSPVPPIGSIAGMFGSETVWMIFPSSTMKSVGPFTRR